MLLLFASEIFSFAIPEVERMPLGKFLTFSLVILQSHDLHANFLSQLFSRWLLPSLRLTGYVLFFNLFKELYLILQKSYQIDLWSRWDLNPRLTDYESAVLTN